MGDHYVFHLAIFKLHRCRYHKKESKEDEIDSSFQNPTFSADCKEKSVQTQSILLSPTGAGGEIDMFKSSAM